jgi:hypothetical protein
MRALGIDIGSSSIKGAVLDLSSLTVMTPVARPFPSPIEGLRAGWVEIDPIAVIHAVDEVLSSLLDQAPDATWLGLSGQMGGLMTKLGRLRIIFLGRISDRSSLVAMAHLYSIGFATVGRMPVSFEN